MIVRYICLFVAYSDIQKPKSICKTSLDPSLEILITDNTGKIIICLTNGQFYLKIQKAYVQRKTEFVDKKFALNMRLSNLKFQKFKGLKNVYFYALTTDFEERNSSFRALRRDIERSRITFTPSVHI